GPTERLARGDVRQVELDERDRDREQRVAERDARVRECGRVEQNEIDLLAARGMDAPDQLVLGVALKRVERVPGGPGELLQPRLDIGERRMSVELGLSGAEQAEIRAVQQQQSRHPG